jgi:hypothetical protein
MPHAFVPPPLPHTRARVCVCALCTAGDLEDLLCSIAWPLFCFVCGASTPLGSGCPSPKATLRLALLFTFVVLLALSVVTVVALPETLLELARVACMDSLAPAT